MLGKEHPHTLMTVWKLAALRRQQGLHESAIEVYQRAAAGFTNVLGPNHPDTLRCSRDLLSLRSQME